MITMCRKHESVTSSCPQTSPCVAVRSTALSLTATEGFTGPIDGWNVDGYKVYQVYSTICSTRLMSRQDPDRGLSQLYTMCDILRRREEARLVSGSPESCPCQVPCRKEFATDFAISHETTSGVGHFLRSDRTGMRRLYAGIAFELRTTGISKYIDRPFILLKATTQPLTYSDWKFCEGRHGPGVTTSATIVERS